MGPPLKVGEWVACTIPLHWGNVPAGTKGEVIGYRAYGARVVVAFPVLDPRELYPAAYCLFDNPSPLLVRVNDLRRKENAQ